MNQHIIIAAVMIAGFGFVVAPSFTNQENRTTKAARDICADTIRASLHNPRSVEWVNRNSWQSTPRAGGGLTITATYRATNGFGATVMSTTQCEVAFNGGRYTVEGFR